MSKRNALLLMVLVTLIWSTNGLLIKLVSWSPMSISGLRSLFAAAVLLPFLGIPFIVTSGFPESGWYWIIPMGAIGAGLSFVLYTVVLKRLKAIEAIITQTIEPVFNPIWVFIAVGETPGSWALLGGMIVLSSVTLHAVLQQRTVKG